MISSPFTSGFKDTTPSAPAGTAGAVPGPAADYPQNQVMPMSTTSASWDSPYNESIVQSISTVTSADPGGSAPMESPFKDAWAK